MAQPVMKYDVALVGAGPANMALAYRLASKARAPMRIAVLEKANRIGSHLLSGAVSNPRALDELFPGWRDEENFPIEAICSESHLTVLGAVEHADVPRFAMPSYFKKEGYAVLNVSDLCAHMATRALEAAKESARCSLDIYTGFPALDILYDGNRVIGVKVDDTGDEVTDNLYADVTVFGDRGFVSRSLVEKFDLRATPQIWAVGVKELWEVERDYAGKVWHTVGYPVSAGDFGGGFIYGMKNNRLVIGLVIGLDSQNPNLRPARALQDLKRSPWVQSMLKGGNLLKYGASTLPEGGYYSLPKKFAVDGAMLVGDALGTLDVKRFSGVDKAMKSGIVAADAILEAFQVGAFSESKLSSYQSNLMSTFVGEELREGRYLKRVFKEYPELTRDLIPSFVEGVDAGKGLVGAAITFGLTKFRSAVKLLGALKLVDNPGDHGAVHYKEDRSYNRPDYDERSYSKRNEDADSSTLFSTADIVYYAKTHYEEENDHIEEFDAQVCHKCIRRYEDARKDTPCVGDCTAEVHQTLLLDGKRTHKMALENCVQCQTCEIVCPESNLRVSAAAHGYGPDFSGM